MFDRMKQLAEMKKQADRIKRELDGTTVEVNEVSGIKMVVTGAQNFCSLEIDRELLKEDNKGKIESDLLRSINAAIKKSQNVASQKMASVMPGL